MAPDARSSRVPEGARRHRRQRAGRAPISPSMCWRPDFDRGVALLADNELHPALPQAGDGHDSGTARAADRGAQTRARPILPRARCAWRCSPRTIPPCAIRRRKSIGALKRDDVLAYYKLALRPDLTTIVVIGKITPEAAARGDREIFRRLGGKRPQAADRSSHGAAQCRVVGRRARCEPRPGQCGLDPDAGTQPRRSGLPTRCSSAIRFSAAASIRHGSASTCARTRAWSIPSARSFRSGARAGNYYVQYASDPENAARPPPWS